jgi:hypothetical protein
MNVLACYVQRDDNTHVRGRINEACSAAGLRSVKWCTSPKAGDLFLSVLARALAIVRRGERVTVVAQFSDIIVPEGVQASQDDFSDEEWRHSWKAYLEARGVVFLAVDPGGMPAVELSTRTSVIRSYQRATQALERAIELARQAERRDAGEIAYFYGRPPYGYKVEKGQFVVNPPQANAVKEVFQLLLAGTNGGDVVAAMAKRPRIGRKRREYWDRKKIKRIIDHASLYCTGTYKPKTGQQVTIPGLAFLPAKWLDRLKAVQERKLAQAPTVALVRSRKAGKGLDLAAPIPSCEGTGTMGANPPTGAAS